MLLLSSWLSKFVFFFFLLLFSLFVFFNKFHPSIHFTKLKMLLQLWLCCVSANRLVKHRVHLLLAEWWHGSQSYHSHTLPKHVVFCLLWSHKVYVVKAVEVIWDVCKSTSCFSIKFAIKVALLWKMTVRWQLVCVLVCRLISYVYVHDFTYTSCVSASALCSLF